MRRELEAGGGAHPAESLRDEEGLYRNRPYVHSAHHSGLLFLKRLCTRADFLPSINRGSVQCSPAQLSLARIASSHPRSPSRTTGAKLFSRIGGHSCGGARRQDATMPHLRLGILHAQPWVLADPCLCLACMAMTDTASLPAFNSAPTPSLTMGRASSSGPASCRFVFQCASVWRLQCARDPPVSPLSSSAPSD